MSVMIRLLEQRFFSKIALICFLLTLPLSIRKVLFVFPPYGTSGFNEYTDISLYLSDITLVALLLFILLENKISILSINYWKRMFHVEHVNNYEDQYKDVPRGTLELEQGFCWYKCSTWNNLACILLLPLPFVLWSIISTLWSENEMLAFYASIRLFLGYLFYLALTFMIVPRGTFAKLNNFPSKKNDYSTWNTQRESIKDEKLFHVEQTNVLNKNVPRGTIKRLWLVFLSKCSTWNISNILAKSLIFGGIAQSVIAIGQFIGQSSLQLTFLWESQFSAFQAGIAKIIYHDQVFIRSYGLFPHPNVLAAFLAITIILTLKQWFILHQKMFHVEQLEKSNTNVPRGTLASYSKELPRFDYSFLTNGWSFSGLREMFHVEHYIVFTKLALIIQVFGFLSTFSKGAFLGLFLGLSYIFYKLLLLRSSYSLTRNVPRGTIDRSKWTDNKICSTWNIWSYELRMFHVEHSSSYVRIIIFGVVGALFVSMINWYFFIIQPIKERFFLQNIAFTLFKENPIWGSGIAQSVYFMQNFSLEKLEAWQFQPVHNVFFLISTELGIIGCILFLLTLFIVAKRMFHVEHARGTIREKIDGYFFTGLGIVILVTSLFDHFYWDIQQGQLLFWLTLSLLVSIGVLKKGLTK